MDASQFASEAESIQSDPTSDDYYQVFALGVYTWVMRCVRGDRMGIIH